MSSPASDVILASAQLKGCAEGADSFSWTTGLLPPGSDDATFDEVEAVFGATYKRRKILAGLRWVVERLRAEGVIDIYVDGSFVTDKERPGDVDVV